MTPLVLFLYVVATALGLAVAAVILGATYVIGGAIVRRLTRG